MPCRSDKAVMVSAGMQADMKTLHKMMQARNVQYAHAHRKPMSVGALAQLLGNTLYYKRFFPYYTFNLVAGLDSEGGWALERSERTLTPCLHPTLPFCTPVWWPAWIADVGVLPAAFS